VITLIYDNNIGAWLPPDDNKVFSSYFEKDGILYSTKIDDDTIYQMDEGEEDAGVVDEEDTGIPFESVIGTPILEFENGRQYMEYREFHVSGGISEAGEVQVELIVNGGTPQIKTIDTTGLSFGDLTSMGTVTLGTTTLGGESGTVFAEWDRRYGVYPRYGSKFQCVLSSEKPFYLSSYNLLANALPRPLLQIR
jgi:hypothetical protein